MPRVTRRSLAATEDKAEKPEPQPTKSKGRRGAKNAEPEDSGSVDEPQETPAKQGRRGKAKEPTPTVEAPKGRAASRSTGRGKNKVDVEPEPSESEEEPEEKEEKVTTKRGSTPRGRGRGKGRGRASGRGSRGKAAEEEEEEEEMEEEESPKPVEEPKAASSSRSRGRSKAAVEEEPKEIQEEVKTTPRGRQRKTPTKPAETAPTPPSSGKRRSGRKGQATEEVAPEDEEPVVPPATDKAEKEKDEEAMDAEEEQAEPAKSQETPQKEEPQVKDAAVGQKRKHEEEEEKPDNTLKRARLSDTAPATSASDTPKEDAKKELDDFVLVSKDDVPAADSKEVAEALPPSKKEEATVSEEDSTTKKPESSSDSNKTQVKKTEEPPKEVQEPMEVEATKETESATIKEPKLPEKAPEETKATEAKVPETPMEMKTDEPPVQKEVKEAVAPIIPAVVPLTEAELAKQYNPVVRDRDETSSTLVEVGSEATSDVLSSTRNLDVSDMTSVDMTSEHTNEESNTSSASDLVSSKETDPVTPTPINEKSNAHLSDIPLPSVTSEVVTPAPAGVANSVPTPQPPATTVPLNSIPLPPTSTNVSAAETLSSAPASSTPPAVASNHTTSTNATHNGNVRPSDPVLSVPLPAKRPNFASLEGYVPSSTTFDKRKFIINPNFPIELFDTAFCFSVVSYNILADIHMRKNDYSYTEPQFLEQTYRHKVLAQEIEYLDGDIMCMQEVQTAYYNDVLLPLMKSKGYQGMFMKRTKELFDEGEATFVKTSKFEVLSHQGLSLKDLAYKEIDSGSLSDEVTRAAKKYMDRPDVIVLCKLLSKKTGKTLTVCNIHVVWDMPSPDVQCFQVACAIKELVSMAGSDLNPYIICGDFNSEVTSPAYHLAKEGYLSDAHIRSLQALEKMDNTDGSSRSLINHVWRAFQHTSSNLRSGYETAVGKEPGLTSFTKQTHAALDYIFFSASSMYTVGTLETIDQQVLEATGGLPSKHIPSDHVSLKTVFRLKD